MCGAIALQTGWGGGGGWGGGPTDFTNFLLLIFNGNGYLTRLLFINMQYIVIF